MRTLRRLDQLSFGSYALESILKKVAFLELGNMYDLQELKVVAKVELLKHWVRKVCAL